jgi:hypothetical protein
MIYGFWVYGRLIEKSAWRFWSLVGKVGGEIGVSIVWDFCKRQEM